MALDASSSAMGAEPRSKFTQSAELRERGARAEFSSLDDSRLYVNRELSLLQFQRRVLEEAQGQQVPLLERLKFLAIVSSNLNEFFMVRVSGLLDQMEAGIGETPTEELTPAEQLEAIRREVTDLMTQSRQCLLDELLPALGKAGIHVADYEQLATDQRALVNAYFSKVVFPVLTPLAFDPGRPFPHISNLSLNLAVVIRDGDGVERFARVKVPDTLPALVRVMPSSPLQKGRRKPVREAHFVWLEQMIAANLDMLFPGMEVLQAHPFHIVRDADLEIQELEAEDLLETIEEGVRRRRFGSVVRLAVHEDMPPSLLEILMSNLAISDSEVYRLNGPLALNRLMSIYGIDRPDLKETPFVPKVPRALDPKTDEEDVFTAIRRENILLHHPFDSFQPVIDFLEKAAHDPDVLAIKMTLYRVGRNSPVVKTLLAAQENGKQVAVLVELKARFDEESNIEWARALEREGVHVVYGFPGVKIHAKVALVVRREGDLIRRYVHLATGNYNAVTAQLYTDLGYFTCDEQIASDASDLFNHLTGYSAKTVYRKLFVAPINLREKMEELIRREIEHQRRGERGHLIFKTNGLVDTELVRLLYEASQAGVRVDLLVRGICCLRPDIAGVSRSIRVTSIVGRFLEHSRIYYFRNAGSEEIYLGSADLMPRNLNRRVETVFPIADANLVHHLRNEVLGTYLADNAKARRMKSDGSYVRVHPAEGESVIDSQAAFIGRDPLRR